MFRPLRFALVACAALAVASCGGGKDRPKADLAASRRVMVVADAMAEALTARRHELETP